MLGYLGACCVYLSFFLFRHAHEDALAPAFLNLTWFARMLWLVLLFCLLWRGNIYLFATSSRVVIANIVVNFSAVLRVCA